MNRLFTVSYTHLDVYKRQPQYNQNGVLAWMQMKRDGFEADKQDLIVLANDKFPINLTAHRDDIHVEGFKWSEDGRSLFFWAPINGTLQLFQVNNPGLTKMLPVIKHCLLYTSRCV